MSAEAGFVRPRIHVGQSAPGALRHPPAGLNGDERGFRGNADVAGNGYETGGRLVGGRGRKTSRTLRPPVSDLRFAISDF